MKITAAIITFNEEDHIRAACESVAWADEILIVEPLFDDDMGHGGKERHVGARFLR